jgi:hypothetical protein
MTSTSTESKPRLMNTTPTGLRLVRLAAAEAGAKAKETGKVMARAVTAAKAKASHLHHRIQITGRIPVALLHLPHGAKDQVKETALGPTTKGLGNPLIRD